MVRLRSVKGGSEFSSLTDPQHHWHCAPTREGRVGTRQEKRQRSSLYRDQNLSKHIYCNVDVALVPSGGINELLIVKYSINKIPFP